MILLEVYILASFSILYQDMFILIVADDTEVERWKSGKDSPHFIRDRSN